MKKLFTLSILTSFYIFFGMFNVLDLSVNAQVKPDVKPPEREVFKVDAAIVKINSKTVEIVADDRLSNKKGMTLKAGVAQAINGERSEPDIVFSVKSSTPGLYDIRTYAVTDEEGAALMKKAKGKYESLFMRVQIDERRPTSRVVYVPWDRPSQHTGKFELSGDEQEVKIWLPRGVRFEFMEFKTYVPPGIPANALDYKPTVLPPLEHPRLWVNQQTLPLVKSRLEVGENKAAWEKIKNQALTPFDFTFNPDVEMAHNAELERAAEAKAFYYLMTGDKKVGREAIDLMLGYLTQVEFGNILDITREIGRAIFTASEVYDWSYDLLTPDEKHVLYSNLMRLASDMEIGWPPFKTKILNGHGNEAQVNRDLLSMSIAIYNEDPLPYQYCSYAVLEELVPMRKFEYQSPRHNQGVNYGAYRFGWEMHAVWMLYRMSGQAVFDDNIKNVPKFWQYMRAPDGQMLRDGDGFSSGAPGKPYYWSSPQTMLLSYAYAKDPILKADFERQGGLPNNPVLFLLLNDPAMKAEPDWKSLPLTIDFGPVLGSMVARTGWEVGEKSSDVVAEIKGGGYHFGNHQQADAGSIQLYYRGFQFGDIGVYKFYGTPYDMGFNKRSIAHSMMLAVDPKEEFVRSEANDGGIRLNQRAPVSPQQVQTDPWFNNGKVLSADFGPSKLKPFYSYFAVDLVGAYSNKIDTYTRGFCFLNMDRDDIPAVIIMTDDIITSDPGFKKYWQINTLNVPEQTSNGFILNNKQGDLVGKTHVQMLLPVASDRQVEVLSGEEANNVFDTKLEAPETSHREGSANRIMVSPRVAADRDRFLTVFQVADGDTKPLPVKHSETEASYVVYIDDRIVSMSNSADLINKSFTLDIPSKGEYQVVLAGMEAGEWNVKGQNNKVKFNATIAEGENTLFFKAGKGKYIISPGANTNAKSLIVDENFMPQAKK